jgi:hypothetical protein
MSGLNASVESNIYTPDVRILMVSVPLKVRSVPTSSTTLSQLTSVVVMFDTVVPPAVVTLALKEAGLEHIYEHPACAESTDPVLPIAHAGTFVRDTVRVYKFRTIVPLRLVIICECLDDMYKHLGERNIDLVNDDCRRTFYCGAFANSLTGDRLDGYLGKDAGLFRKLGGLFMWRHPKVRGSRRNSSCYR